MSCKIPKPNQDHKKNSLYLLYMCLATRQIDNKYLPSVGDMNSRKFARTNTLNSLSNFGFSNNGWRDLKYIKQLRYVSTCCFRVFFITSVLYSVMIFFCIFWKSEDFCTMYKIRPLIFPPVNNFLHSDQSSV